MFGWLKKAFQYVGKKIGDGWNSVKAFGKKAWNTVKEKVPVLGSIANFVDKYTPIGSVARNIFKAVDTAATGSSKLLQGDVKGAIGTATSYGRDILNTKSAVTEGLKNVPILGKVASGLESVVSNVPIFGGASLNTIRSVGNAGLNAVDAFKEGDVKGGLINIAKGGAGYLGSKGGGLGMAGKAAGKIL
jgi:phage-related protein